MSLKTLPILYINLGGEMIYVLDQRLRAQNIKDATSNKVIREIISTMFETNLMSEIFKPCILHSMESFKILFEKLAHSSVMKLNEQSMTKLYELMVMAVKSEILNSPRPKDIMSVTLNHLDEMLMMVGNEDRTVINLIENVYVLLHKIYAKLTHGEYMRIRNSMLTFFQDMNIRVSSFLQDKTQTSEGKMTIKIEGLIGYDVEAPGQIKYYHSTGEIKQLKKFDCAAGPYIENNFEGSFERFGKRGVKLGKNIYSNLIPSDTSNSVSQTPSYMKNCVSDLQAKAQLDLLTNLIGRKQANKMKTEFKLNLFNSFNDEDDEFQENCKAEEKSPGGEAKSNIKSHVVYVDVRKSKNDEMTKIMGDLNISHIEEKDEDLLTLMDAS